MSSTTRAVIFDLDGTLLDTEALYLHAAQQVCARHGAQYTLELKRQLMGGDARTGAEVVVTTLGLAIDAGDYLRQREEALLEKWATTQPMPGAHALLTALAERKVPIAIATSGHAHLTALKLQHQPFLGGVSVVVCGDDARVRRGKPEPDIFLAAAAELGVPAHACAVIEDSVNGVRAALAAGMHTIALIDPRWGLPPDAFAAAAHRIASLTELNLAMLGIA